jgi:hypothetical protein
MTTIYECQAISAHARLYLCKTLDEDEICKEYSVFNEDVCNLRTAFKNASCLQQPAALIVHANASPAIQALLSEIKQAGELKLLSCQQVLLIEEPVEPESYDYTEYWEDEQLFDIKGFEAALQYFESEKAAYQRNIETGVYQKGLIEIKGNFYPVLFRIAEDADLNRGQY